MATSSSAISAPSLATICGRPTPAPFRLVYPSYLKLAVPLLGALLSGRGSAYSYLSSSIREFPDQKKMTSLLGDAGFSPVRHVDFVRGIAARHREAFAFPDRKACGDKLIALARPNDRIVIMGARDDTLAEFAADLLRRLTPST